MPLIDAFSHVALPRFLSADGFLRIMDDHKVEAAIITCAETCPDVGELSKAILEYPDRFRAVGIAMGRDVAHIREVLRAQLDAGFSGIRLTASQIAADSELLGLIGAAGAVPYVFGPDLFTVWRNLHEFLEAFGDTVVCAPHFCGVADTSIFEKIPDARRLLDHERFLVIFSRRGAFDLMDIGPVARFFVHELGWERILWGSEYPVCLWRNESYLSTADWIDMVGLKPSETQRKAFLYANAKKHLMRPRAREPLKLDADALGIASLRRASPVWLFPRTAVELDEEIHRTLFLAYLARGGDQRMPYSQFIASLLSDAARRLEG